ncbi:AAA family ATPase [Calidifontibacillus erzurumensis]|uniref:AAA family ATPase n=1 Tax=Calidifontibacillus erzurumensis TaxID=2741433 RepID=UPI0035B53EA6
MQSLHLVLPSDFIEGLKEELESDGFEILYTDTSLDTFSQWANSDDDQSAEIAIIDGMAVVSKENNFFSKKQAIFDRLKEVRLARENIRMIIIFPSEIRNEVDFISKIAQLGIYDIYFVNEIFTDDIVEWINNPKGYSHVDAMLQGYQASEDFKVEKEVVYRSVEYEDDPKEEETNKKKEQEESKLFSHLKALSQLKQTEIRFQYRSFSSKVITITSTKGGIGKTDIAINLAAAIREHTNINKIVVVDFDFPYGGIAAALQLRRTSDLGDWLLKKDDVVTEEGIKNKVVRFKNIDFIPMSLNIKNSLKFQELQAEIMIDILKRYYDVIVIDTSGFTKAAIVAIERSSEVILVTSHDIVSLSNAIAYKEDLIKLYGIDYEKISVFINKCPKNEDISKEQIAHMFEDNENSIPIIGYAPYDDVVRQCRNKAEFIYEKKPNHPFSLGIDMILQQLGFVHEEALKEKKKSLVAENISNTLGLFKDILVKRKVE